jgi:FkbM family methyltransferase
VAARTRLARAYVSRRRDFPLSVGSAIGAVVRPPCTVLGRRFITSVVTEGEFLVVHLSWAEHPVYWPREIPLFDLYKVVTEGSDTRDPHYYEAPQTQVRVGDVVLDLGASEGLFAMRASSRASQVFAFEPNSVFVRALHRTFAVMTNVDVVPQAIGAEDGAAVMRSSSLYGSIGSGGDGGVEVSMTSIDNWTARTACRVDFIKADIEGAEFDALLGAKKTIAAYRPKLALTVYHRGNDWQRMRELLVDLVPDYRFKVKGVSYNDRTPRPVMLHAWPEA